MSMAHHDPAQAYRRVALDARVEGGDGVELARLCLEEAVAALARARHADASGDLARRNRALARAAGALAALGQGVARDNPLRGPLLELYGAGERAVRAAMGDYREDVLARVALDLADIRAAIDRA